jgi:hypothetical protein
MAVTVAIRSISASFKLKSDVESTKGRELAEKASTQPLPAAAAAARLRICYFSIRNLQ